MTRMRAVAVLAVLASVMAVPAAGAASAGRPALSAHKPRSQDAPQSSARPAARSVDVRDVVNHRVAPAEVATTRPLRFPRHASPPETFQPAAGGKCSTSWVAPNSGDWFTSSNWNNGVPVAGSTVCITVPGTYQVSIGAEEELGGFADINKLQLGGSAGVQTLAIVGHDNLTQGRTAGLTLELGGVINAHGAIHLSSDCALAKGQKSCPKKGGAAFLDIASDLLENAGKITTDPGTDGGAFTRYLLGSIDNTGTIDVQTPTQYDGEDSSGQTVVGSTLDNKGVLSIETKQTLLVPNTASSTVVNGVGGSITNFDSSGMLYLDGGNTFEQGAGTITPATADPGSPAVVLNDSALSYTGTGAGTVVFRGTGTLSGSISSGQHLAVQGYDDGASCTTADAVAQTAFFNAGQITLTQRAQVGTGGACGAILDAAAGTFTNVNRLTFDPGSNAATRYLEGNLTNTGTIRVNAPTQYDGTDPAGPVVSGSTWLNGGLVTIGDGVTVTSDAAVTVTNRAGGLITNSGGSGMLSLGFESTFNQGAGTISPASPDPSDPAVVVTSGALNFTGAGAGTVVVRGITTLSGDIAAGQNVVLQGFGSGSGACNPQENARAVAGAGFTNAGTLTLTAAGSSPTCTAIIEAAAGTLTNTGTIITDPGSNTATRYLEGSLINAGTVTVNTPTQYDGDEPAGPVVDGNPLAQTAGTTMIAAGQSLSLDDPSQTFKLLGGVLTGTGTLVGSVNATGGSVVPGDIGVLTISADYVQGPRAALAVEIDGPVAGKGYDQLVVGGTATIDGVLEVHLDAGFTPSLGQDFQVITSKAKLTGSLAHVEATGGFDFTTSSASNSASAVASTQRVSPKLVWSNHVATYRHEQADNLTVRVPAAVSGVPTGSVTVMSGKTTLCTSTLVNGVVHCSLSPKEFRPGRQALTVTYNGDKKFSASTVHALLTVRKTPINVSLKLSKESTSVAAETSIRFEIRASSRYGGVASGLVKISSHGKVLCEVHVHAGEGSCSMKHNRLAKGDHSILATYESTSTFALANARRVRIDVT